MLKKKECQVAETAVLFGFGLMARFCVTCYYTCSYNYLQYGKYA